MKSLKALQHALSDSQYQLDVLEHSEGQKAFFDALKEIGLYPLQPAAFEIFQVNVGKMCNQTCKHCHVDAGPDRKEIMSRDTMSECLGILRDHPEFETVDLTGGAPEMNPNFRWFVEEIKKLDRKIIVRCNLTIIVANKKYHDLPDFFKSNQVEVVSSLPFYSKSRTDRQRGDGVFEDSIQALQMLNAVGYGTENSGLLLNLVYNPSGAFLPADQSQLEQDFKSALFKDFGVMFNHLFTITNMPISRYLEFLLVSGNYEHYMQKLISAFNPAAAKNVMCRNTLSIGWDGFIYDCDFNQMLDLKVESPVVHIRNFNKEALIHRNIVIGQHCFGCTAGSGSSCGGATV
ncbi:MAG: arsenosugar biosynthesis radical SAM protein ArsS [Saprospiraceae bacterium]|nr:arsenosugar biosynthesis radical SAM protein ArsS [Saprospiraceae bacterium]